VARKALVAAVALLALVRHDVWLRDDPTRVLGLPAGLTWHVGFCLAVSVVMAGVARWAWPDGLDDDAGDDPSAPGPRP